MNTLQNEFIRTRQQLLIHSTSAFGIVTIVLLCTFPITADLAQGFHTPIIAFEFAKSEADLSFLISNSELSVLNRNAMDNGHFWDMGFPFAYGGFIALALLQLANQVHRILLLGTAVAILIIPFDIQENLVLLDITEALGQSADTTTSLSALAEATWLKWGALGASIFILAIGYGLAKHCATAALSFLTATSIGVCWISKGEPIAAEIMSASVAILFMFLTTKSVIASWAISRYRRQT